MLKALFKNCGKPQGVLGKLMLHGMNAGHGTLSEWGLSQIRIPMCLISAAAAEPTCCGWLSWQLAAPSAE